MRGLENITGRDVKAAGQGSVEALELLEAHLAAAVKALEAYDAAVQREDEAFMAYISSMRTGEHEGRSRRSWAAIAANYRRTVDRMSTDPEVRAVYGLNRTLEELGYEAASESWRLEQYGELLPPVLEDVRRRLRAAREKRSEMAADALHAAEDAREEALA